MRLKPERGELISLNHNMMYTTLVLVEFEGTNDFYTFYSDIKFKIYSFCIWDKRCLLLVTGFV